LDALQSEQPSKKRPLPKAKIPELVAALGKLDNLPSREKQREALRNLPPFKQYHLTEAVLREASAIVRSSTSGGASGSTEDGV
jgi:hypothetical protein